MQRTPIQRAAPAPKQAPPPEAAKALLVIHGMGEQLRFETLDDAQSTIQRLSDRQPPLVRVKK